MTSTRVRPARPGAAATSPSLATGDLRGLDLVACRPVLVGPTEILFRLAPGDRALVAPGDAIVAGTAIAERLRDARAVELAPSATSDGARAGDRWMTAGQTGVRLRRGSGAEAGELLYEHGGHWVLAAGEHAEAVDCPLAGVVRDVRPGIGIRVRAQGRALLGVEALGDPTFGLLSLGSERGDQRHGRLRSTSLDVGLAGTILVIGSRVDAEALTRARAMGVRGVIVSGLAGKERRDFLASESRQRAALHRLPPFAVLVLDGAIRRPIAGPVAAVLEALSGKTVAITIDPPALVFDEPALSVAAPPADHVRVRAGEHAGEEGRWAGLAGVRRFAGGSFLEAGWVVLGDDPPVSIPIADLERFA
ncbi:MAG TPA: hypothetical protein VHM48_00325 [Candidatus Limnocylindrales bacterium]|nr:hypothetical protein [Candidatus Limnocylindrales bacterium]